MGGGLGKVGGGLGKGGSGMGHCWAWAIVGAALRMLTIPSTPPVTSSCG